MSWRDDEDGQALAEFGLISLLLVPMLGGILYFGSLIVTQEKLAIAGRAAARRMALTATEHMLTQKNPSPGSADAAVREALPGLKGVRALGVNWGNVQLGNGRQMDAHSASWAKTGKVKVGSKSFRCGIGCKLYGVKVQWDVDKDLSAAGRMVTALGGKLAGLASLGSVAVMPGDLPPQGGEASVMGLNPWIGEIVNMKDPK